jgi:hypothetical protein
MTKEHKATIIDGTLYNEWLEGTSLIDRNIIQMILIDKKENAIFKLIKLNLLYFAE